MDEDLTSKAGVLNTSFILLPRKQFFFLSFDVAAGIGVLVNKFNVHTTLWVYDTATVYNSLSMVNELKKYAGTQMYDESKLCFGGMFNLDANFYIGEYFSFFYKFNYGEGGVIDIASKSFTVHNQTANVKAHKEFLNGYGNTFGIAAHFWHKRIKPKPFS